MKHGAMASLESVHFHISVVVWFVLNFSLIGPLFVLFDAASLNDMIWKDNNNGDVLMLEMVVMDRESLEMDASWRNKHAFHARDQSRGAINHKDSKCCELLYKPCSPSRYHMFGDI